MFAHQQTRLSHVTYQRKLRGAVLCSWFAAMIYCFVMDVVYMKQPCCRQKL